jgi:replication initiation protein RepC
MGQYGLSTPFGRRAVSLGHVAAGLQMDAELEARRTDAGNHPAAVEKWRLLRTLTSVRERLGLSDRSLGLLQALLSFHPETALTLPVRSGEGAEEAKDPSPSADLVVFPSNRQLGLRANGMAEKTIRRHLAALVGAGLIVRRDSANGKRYARRAMDDAERFSEAFGFDLTPLVLRAAEFESMAEEMKREERRRTVLRGRISVKRRDCAKLIALALSDGMAGDWEPLRLRFLTLVTPLRQVKSTDALEELARELDVLTDLVGELVRSAVGTLKLTGNDGGIDRHISNSKTDVTSEFEPASNWSRGETGVHSQSDGLETKMCRDEPCSIGLVAEACPDIADYGPTPKVRTWSDVIDAARTIRPMLGISPDAWSDAVSVLGEAGAAGAVAVILQRSEFSSEAEIRDGGDGRKLTAVNSAPAIRSPGGYLRALTEKARSGSFALGPVLMATIGQRLKAKRRPIAPAA